MMQVVDGGQIQAEASGPKAHSHRSAARSRTALRSGGSTRTRTAAHRREQHSRAAGTTGLAVVFAGKLLRATLHRQGR